MLHPARISTPPLPPKAFIIRESCIQIIYLVPVGVLGLVAACMILQESQVCKIQAGSWHGADVPCMVPHKQSEDISPLQPTHHPHSVLPDVSLLWRSSYTRGSRTRVACVQNGSWQSPAHHTDQRNSLTWVHQELGVTERKAGGAILILFPDWTISSIWTNVTNAPSCRHAAVLTSPNTKKRR